jgi:acyl-CoA synthetase (AMP-forming)/AMP-acid ligase II
MIQLTVHDLLVRNAHLYPDRIAVEEDGRKLTHLALLKRSSKVANALLKLGCKPGHRVAVLSRNSIEMMEILCACELFGFIAVPLNHRLATAEIGKILQDCTPSLLIGEVFFKEMLEKLHVDMPHSDAIWLMGDSDGSIKGLKPSIEAASENLYPVCPSANAIAHIIYTSGSTGRPKGVMLNQGGLVESGRLLAQPAGVRPNSSQLVIMPLFHVGALAQRMGYVVGGGRLVLQSKFDAETVVKTLASGEITDIHLAPTMLRSLLDVLDQRPDSLNELNALDAVETIKYASSPIPAETLERAMRYFGPRLIQYYGLTEAGAIGTVLHKYAHADAAQGINTELMRSAGHPHLGCEMEIRRPDRSVCDIGEDGEIWLRSNAMMSGYWNDEERTKEALENGWLRTGDVGRFNEANYLFIMDRMKDMIVSGGENIYSAEIERALETHPAVLESAVIGIPDERWGESVHAFVVLKPGEPTLTQENLIEYCKTQIASFKKPRSIDFLASMPRLQHVQKIDKQTLRAPFWANQKKGVN